MDEKPPKSRAASLIRSISTESNVHPPSSVNKTQSPAACLPYDVLQEIFQYLLPRKPLTDLQPRWSSLPLAFCHMCVSWRTAAFGTHRLWKYLHLRLRLSNSRIPDYNIVVPQNQVDMINWWTTRIPNSNYTYSFHFTHLKDRHALDLEVEGRYVNYLEVFRIRGVRLAKSLTLTMTHEQWHLLCEDSTPFTQLGSLALSFTGGEPGMSDMALPPTPLLRRLETSWAEHKFPWGQLTHLNLVHEIEVYIWRYLLEECTNLLSAIFGLIPDRWTASRSIVHHNLRQLVVQTQSFVKRDLFEGILFPSLHSLRLVAIQSAYDHWMHTRVPTPISFPALHTILLSTPSLRELHLHNGINFSHLPDNLGSFLETMEPLSSFIPRLEHLVIEHMLERICGDVERITAFVRSRWMCANWGSNPSSPSPPEPSGSDRTPHLLHVEIISSKSDGHSIVGRVRRAVEDVYHPHVHLTFTERWDTDCWGPPLVVAFKPGALDNWEELVKFRIPIE